MTTPNILKTLIQSKSRKLTATWSIEIDKDINASYDDHFAKILQEEIDREIVQDLKDKVEKNELMKQGWVVAPFTSEKFGTEHIAEVTAWIHTYATGEYKVFGREFWFQRKADLTAFILKWS